MATDIEFRNALAAVEHPRARRWVVARLSGYGAAESVRIAGSECTTRFSTYETARRFRADPAVAAALTAGLALIENTIARAAVGLTPPIGARHHD